MSERRAMIFQLERGEQVSREWAGSSFIALTPEPGGLRLARHRVPIVQGEVVDGTARISSGLRLTL